jgi:peptide/nickel transport system permease protein
VLAYIGRRISIILLILFGSSFLVYNLEAIAADPLEDLRNSTAKNKAYLIQHLTQQLQLDVPPPARYFLWLKGVLGVFIGHPDLGLTRERQSVAEAIGNAIPVTIRLVLGATIIAILLGITIGVVTAIRQYSRFDYTMTFISFLLFSLPIFWVAVLLKQFMAIGFNDFLDKPVISIPWIVGASVVTGFVMGGAIGGSLKRVTAIFSITSVATAALLLLLNLTKWFVNPGLGPITILLLGAGIAVAVTSVSVGLANRRALYASLTSVAIGMALYFPLQIIFDNEKLMSTWVVVALAAGVIVVGTLVGYLFAKVDKGTVIRTTIITSVLVAFLIFLDRLMRSFKGYFESDSINGRPVPTIGLNNQLLSKEELANFWTSTLDTTMHMILPTIALTLISFAGYVRYSRGSLLEVLNMDYIRTARAKGLTERTVIVRHALRNAMIPLTTLMAFDFAGVIGGAIITEQVFAWKGMGTLFNQAIGSMDLNLLMGVFSITSFMAVLANLVADLLYTALDPRIRVK